MFWQHVSSFINFYIKGYVRQYCRTSLKLFISEWGCNMNRSNVLKSPLILFTTKLVGSASLKILKQRYVKHFWTFLWVRKAEPLFVYPNKFPWIAQLYFSIGIIEQSYCQSVLQNVYEKKKRFDYLLRSTYLLSMKKIPLNEV